MTRLKPDKVYVAVHGIGDAQPDFYKKWDIQNILGIDPNQVVGFHYENLLEGSDINSFSKLLVKPVAMFFARKMAGPLVARFGDMALDFATDYINDIFTFFLSRKTRVLIGESFDQLIAETHDVTVFAHSLGSLFLLWYCWSRPTLMTGKLKVVLLGSPYGSPYIGALCRWGFRKFLKVEPSRPEVPILRNIYSDVDPLSGKLPDTVASDDQQYRIRFGGMCRHREVDEYIQAYYNQFFLDLKAVEAKGTFAEGA